MSRARNVCVTGNKIMVAHGYPRPSLPPRRAKGFDVPANQVACDNAAGELLCACAVLELPSLIWRKLSFGTQSSAGNRFVERLLTVVETCRRQKRNVFSWLVEAVEARFAGKTAPSLLSGV